MQLRKNKILYSILIIKIFDRQHDTVLSAKRMDSSKESIYLFIFGAGHRIYFWELHV